MAHQRLARQITGAYRTGYTVKGELDTCLTMPEIRAFRAHVKREANKHDQNKVFPTLF